MSLIPAGDSSNAKNKLGDILNRVEEIYDYQIDPDCVEQKLADLEDRSRNNLRVDDILQTPGEIWVDHEEKLQQVLQEKPGLECPTEIERAHQT